ncbi:MAG: anti-sigma factor [Sphingorhabdus sp.]
MSRLSEDDIALAGEYVLGLLDPAETVAANARAATDADFANEVEAWRERLQTMIAGSDMPAPDHVWSGIERALPRPTGQDNGYRRLRIWQGLTAVSASVAAFFAVLLWQQQAPAPITPAPPMVAALGAENGSAAIAARYDATTGELLLTPVSLDTGKLYPELWIVPADGKARSLGMMKMGKPTRMMVHNEMRGFMEQGATLAITPEPEGGAPGGKATGPIIASGRMTTI